MVALDEDILRGFQCIEDRLSQSALAFFRWFWQEIYAPNAYKDDRQLHIELKHGDKAELFWTLRLRC